MPRWLNQRDVIVKVSEIEQQAVGEIITASIPQPVSLIKEPKPVPEEHKPEPRLYCEVKGTKDGYYLKIKSEDESVNKRVKSPGDFYGYYPWDSIGTWHKSVSLKDVSYFGGGIEADARNFLIDFMGSMERVKTNFKVYLD